LVESAPIASNMTEKPQSSASPAPQKTTSCLLSWICSMPTPMQCAPVEHADEIEYETPCSLKAVESTAETVEPIERVTRYGPIRRSFCASTASIVSMMSATDVPPWPRMPPVRGEFISSGESPESATACCIAMKANLALRPMNRACLRSMKSSQLMSGVPHTFDFMPISLYLSFEVMPGLHSCSDVATSSRVFPRHDTMPMPVTTTRRPPGAAIWSCETRCCVREASRSSEGTATRRPTELDAASSSVVSV